MGGNHELYGSNPGRLNQLLDKRQAMHSNFHWLHESSVIIGGYRFVGTTLWFPEQPDNILYESSFNDFNQIQGFRKWVYEANRRAVRYLQNVARPDDIIVTHHVPHPEGIPLQWRRSQLNRFFLCDMQTLIRVVQSQLWIHGHTHERRDYQIGRTRFVCNPFGYAGYEEVPGFDWKLVVEV